MRCSLKTQFLILKTPSSYIFLSIVFRKILENIGELLKISVVKIYHNTCRIFRDPCRTIYDRTGTFFKNITVKNLF